MNKIAGNAKVYRVWCALKYTYGLVAIIAGVDKFFNLITVWAQYVNPFFVEILPLQMGALISLVGVIEIAAGVLVLSKYTRIGAYVVMGWFLFIVAQLLLGVGFYDIAVRDFVIAVGAYALAQLTEVKEGK